MADRDGTKARAGVTLGRLLALCFVGIVLAAVAWFAPAYFSAKAVAEPKLHIGGTSAAALMIENGWRRGFRVAKGIQLDYDSIGSSEGINRVIDGKYSIGFSHTPLTDEQREKAKAVGGDIMQIPVTLCAVVPVYNLKALHDKPPLNFSGEALADIFLGAIDRWNHPTLKALNPGVDLPDLKISVVHRDDSSGTTLIFAEFLQSASPAWRKTIGPAKSKHAWPMGTAKERSKGVAEFIVETDGSIGYLDLVNVDALSAAGGEHGAVQNFDKTAFIQAQASNITAATSSLAKDLSPDLTFSLTNRPGPDSYPIAGGIWAIVYQNQPAAQFDRVNAFLAWVLRDGQNYASDLSYAPLPPMLVEKAQERLQTMKNALPK